MRTRSIQKSTEVWDGVIKPARGWLDIDLGEIFRYRDLILLLVKRDFVTFYKQSILGPLWYIIQPLLNTVVFTIIFGNLAQLSTDGLPPFLFYLSGTVIWGYFSHTLTQTGNTFVANASIFGKVYFPRIAVPTAVAITGLIQFFIQFAFFLAFFFYFMLSGSPVKPNLFVLALPLLILQMAILSLGLGLLVSALTAKYRDLTYAMGFLVQLWMYLTPVVYPLSEVPDSIRTVILLNPMTSVVESFRGAFLGVTALRTNDILLSLGTTIFLFVGGLIAFSRVEKNFMDTV